MFTSLCFVLLAASAAPSDGFATDQDYKIVSTGSSSKLQVGTRGTVMIKIVALNGFKVSAETPFSVKLKAGEGISLDKTTFQRKDTVDPGAKDPQIKTAFLVKSKGEHTVVGELSFFLCTDKLCQRMSAKHAVKVVAE